MKKLLLITIAALSINAKAQTWNTPVQVDNLTGTGGDIGLHTCMLTVNGNPAIAYYDAIHDNLMYRRANDANGTSWSEPITVDSTAIVGDFPSLKIVNGFPAISYYDETNGDLKYIRATNADGSAWGAPVIVESAMDVGEHSSLQIVNGNPAIAYIAGGAQHDLRYVRANDVDGAAWGAPMMVDLSVMFVTGYITLEVVNGAPAISYCSLNTIYSVNYIRANNANGTTWATRVTVNAGTDGGWYASMKIVNGNPAIAYLNRASWDLNYVRATNITGTTWSAPVTVDASFTTGSHCSLEIVNGNPAISYYDETGLNLRYVRATNVSGTTWGTPISIETTGDIGQYTSLKIINGNPAVSYYDVTNTNLKYVRATDISGAAWGTPISFDANGDVGQDISMQLVNGNPAFSYYDFTNQDLKYVRATDATGSAWAAPLAIAVTGAQGFHNSLKVVNGNPAIAYYDNVSQGLRFVRASDASGTAWSAPISVDVSAPGSGWYISLQIVNGYPAISYYEATNDDLKYVRATNADGTAWGTPITVDATGITGLWTSMQIVNGNPAISYYDQDNLDLRYVRANDADGTTWGTPVSVDVTGDQGRYTSLQMVNGNPAISYYDGTNADLRYVRASDAFGTTWATPVSLDAAINSGGYNSLQVINGNPAISYEANGGVGIGGLKYVRATNATGTAWATPVMIETNTYNGGVGEFTSMVPMGTGAGIAYYNRGEGLPFFVYGGLPCNAPSVPTLSAINSTICNGNSTTLSIASGTLNDATNWQWYSTSCGGVSVGSGTSINVSPTTTTTYYVRGEGGCVTASTCGNITITVNPTYTINASASICQGDTYTFPDLTTATSATVHTSHFNTINTCDSSIVTTLTVNPTYTSNASASICQGDTYTFPDGTTSTTAAVHTSLFSTVNTCDSSIVTTLTVNPTYSSNLSASICQGDTYTFPDAATATSATIHTSHFSTINSCDSSIVTTLTVNPLPNVTLDLSTIDTACQNWGIINLTGESPVGGVFTGLSVTGNTFDASIGMGTYTITYTYTDGNSCSNTATGNIYVDVCTGINETVNNNLFSIYPNPTSGQFTIVVADNAEIIVTDVLGQLVIKTQTTQQTTNLQLDNNGVYIVYAKTKQGTTTRKLIVNR